MSQVRIISESIWHLGFPDFPRVSVRTGNRQVTGSTPTREHSDFSDFPRVSVQTSNRQVTCSFPGPRDRQVLQKCKWSKRNDAMEIEMSFADIFFAGAVKRQLDVDVFRHTCLD